MVLPGYGQCADHRIKPDQSIDTEGGILYDLYTTNNAVAPCKNDTTGVNLLIRNCACPSVAVSSPLQGLCSESGTLNLNTLLLTGEPGTWSIVNAPPGTKPAVIAGSNFVSNNSRMRDISDQIYVDQCGGRMP